MRVPRSWCLLQEKSTSAQTGITAAGTRPALEQQVPQWAREQVGRLLTMTRWKRFVLMNVVPVCMAMIWQLSVVIGVLIGFLLGFTLLKLLVTIARATVFTGRG